MPKLELRIWQEQSSPDSLRTDLLVPGGLSVEPWIGRLKKLDSESIKSQEIIYNQDFNIAQLERRIARMQGEVWLILITHKNDSWRI